MIKQQFVVQHEGGKFWLYNEDESSQEELDVAAMDKLANGFRWSTLSKTKNQRKWHASSAVTISLYSMLALVTVKLANGEQVKVLTPDVEITFVN